MVWVPMALRASVWPLMMVSAWMLMLWNRRLLLPVPERYWTSMAGM